MQPIALRRVWHAFIAGAFVITALANCGESGGPNNGPTIPSSSSSTPAPLLLTPPSGSIYLGVYVNPSALPSPPTSLLSNFEQLVGRRMALSLHYYGFYDNFPGTYEADDQANGRIPIDSWDCQIPDAAVAAGNADSAIRNKADAIKAYGHPIFLRYFWEMNIPATSTYRQICYDPNTDLPAGVFSPQYYIAAWDHIRAIFAQEGVSNVIWLWNPDGDRNPAAYYPGNSEVDWTGFDFYDLDNVSAYLTFAQAYSYVSPYGKPVMVGETGAMPSEQPAFFAPTPAPSASPPNPTPSPGLAAALQKSFPLIKGFDYFDSSNKIKTIQQITWVIDTTNTSPGSGFEAFEAMANTPYMQGFQP